MAPSHRPLLAALLPDLGIIAAGQSVNAPMFHFLKASPETALRRDLTRITRKQGKLAVDFDGLRAIVSCPDTGDVLVSEDVSDLLSISANTTARDDAIEQRVATWIAAYARHVLDPVGLVPLLRPASTASGLHAPWSEPFAGDLHLFAALDICGVLAPVTEADLIEHNLRRQGIPTRLRANWAARGDELSLAMRPGELAEVSIPAAQQLSACLLLGGSLWPLIEGLGWPAALAILPTRDHLVLANPRDPSAAQRLQETLSGQDKAPLSRMLWHINREADATPRVSETASHT